MTEDDLGRELDDLLRRAAATQRLGVERALADLGVTPTQCAVLAVVVATPGLSNAEVARIERLTPQTTSLVLANLERKGLVARRPHETHGRILRAEATEAGSRMLAECRARLAGPCRRLAAAAPPDGEREIKAWLARLAAAEV